MLFDNPAALWLLALVLPIGIYIGLPRTRFRYRRDLISLMLRSVILILLILALAGLQWIRPTSRISIVYALDVSDSMGAIAQADALQFIHDSLETLPPDDQAGVIVFADDAFIARSMSNARELGTIHVSPQSGNTHYANAIRLALAILPTDTTRRIVILSDGIPTDDDWESMAQLATISNAEISYIDFSAGDEITSEVAVQSVDVPNVLNPNQDFTLNATLYSQHATESIITVLTNGETIHRQSVSLEAGQTQYPIRLNSGMVGFRHFEVRIESPDGDHFVQNNRLSAFSRVDGNPKILWVDGDGQAEHLYQALLDLELDIDFITPTEIPLSLSDYIPYRSVILSNVSALSLPIQSMQNLEAYVRDLGGGLVVIGGDQSYAIGGYAQTPLESLLPVEMTLEDEQRIPSLTIAYIIDRSGSMTALTPSGVTWLDIAKEAIVRSMETLHEQDRIGIASFDSGAVWLAELQTITNQQILRQQIANISATGGTNIRAGLELVADSIIHEPSTVKHIILLTDGGAPRENLPELSQELYENYGVTTTVISIGTRETLFLEQMAENSGGSYYHATDSDMIPLILAVEPALISRSYIQEGEISLTQRNHPILDGIDDIPPLLGYIATTTRDTATVILAGDEPYQDPVLATWQYGLGRTIAFTSDSGGIWAQNWQNWDDFALFWTQVIRWSLTDGITDQLETQVILRHNQPVISVTARDLNGDFLNHLTLQANVITMTNNTPQIIPLHQVAPGYYEGEFNGDAEGVYLITAHATDNANITPAPIVGWVRGYSKEYNVPSAAENVLDRIASATGGADLSANPQAIFTPPNQQIRTYEPIWHYLVLLALVLLPFDIAIRRLVIMPSDIKRLSAWFRRKTQAPINPETEQRMTTLKEARQRTRERTRANPTINEQASPQTTQPSTVSDGQQPAHHEDSGQDETGNIGSKLLNRRRKN
jgi:uncharacterized membrane protein